MPAVNKRYPKKYNLKIIKAKRTPFGAMSFS